MPSTTLVVRNRGNLSLVPKVVPATLEEVTLAVAKTLMADLPDAGANRPFIDGDHFQNGDGWVGPGPKNGDDRYRDFLDILKPAFVSKNVMDEGCNRLMGAVIGWEPRWTWVPRRHDLTENPQTTEETAAINELTSAMTDWWDARQIHGLLKDLAYKMAWAKESVWRAYVPPSGTDANGRVSVSSLPDALARIYIDIPDPEDATVWEHPDTKQKLGIVLFTMSDGTERVELCWLDDNKKTVIKVLPTPTSGVPEARNDFGGHMTIYAARMRRPLLTEQVRSLQKALNMTLTLLEKGLVDNHFLERFFTNGMPPGHWEYDEDGKTRKKFIPDARATGGQVDSYLQGIDYQDKDGNTIVKDPGVVIRNPLDPQGTIKGAEYWYQAMLEAMRQDHVLINQLATPSGKSRDHSRGDFIDSTKDPVLQVDLAGRELLFTAACMAEAFMGSPGRWTKKFKPVFKCRPNYGPLSTAERQQNIVEAEKGFLSKETAMALNGIDDVDAELSLIDETPQAEMNVSSIRADVVNKWATDFPREVALFLAGYEDNEITEIMRRVGQSISGDPSAPQPQPTPAGGPAAKANVGPPKPTAATKPAPRGRTAAGRVVKPAGNNASTREAAINNG